ncbi:MAG: hypothetical protein JSW10_05175 [Pseudomonadota bacterium]|nr:MAG: hypothetical protein JSW10_05175 [Pseudomonadota bacterium]
MRLKQCLRYRIFSAPAVLFACLLAMPAAADDNGCATGAGALADAYVRTDPVYAYFFGDLELYVALNHTHFASGGDAVRCAHALAQALVKGNIQGHTAPDALRRRQDLDKRLDAMGIAPAPGQGTTAALQFATMSLQIERLARVLPRIAGGDYEVLLNAANQIEEQRMVVARNLGKLFHDPTAAGAFAQLEQPIREVADGEHQLIVFMAKMLVARQAREVASPQAGTDAPAAPPIEQPLLAEVPVPSEAPAQ